LPDDAVGADKGGKALTMRAFTILTVCSGNVCRSPIAEQVLRVRLNRLPSVSVGSAGTMALEGQLMTAEAAAISTRLGGDSTSHQGRILGERSIAEAGLVLAMAREHRRGVVSLVPRASRYTFTIREFARLAADVTDDDFGDIARLPLDDEASRLDAAIALVASRRGAVPAPEDPAADDVVDPYRRSADVYRQTELQIEPAIDAVVLFLWRAATLTRS
jgi:protein-tyrosine phosphatase